LLERKFEEVSWTIKQTFNGVLFTLVPWIVFSVVLDFANNKAAPSRPLSTQQDLINAVFTFIFSALVEGAFLIAPFIYARRVQNPPMSDTRSVWQLLGFRRFNLAIAGPLIVSMLLAFFLINGAYQFVITTFHLHIQTNDQVVFQQSKSEPITTYATLLAAVFVAPFCEEIFFRSFVFMGLTRGMPMGGAILLSALIFAAAHGDPGSFPVLFCIGLALAFVRWRTDSVWPGMILHLLNNGASAVLLILAMHGIGS
jgi:membrane protease YdiL (CAAX protease family)